MQKKRIDKVLLLVLYILTMLMLLVPLSTTVASYTIPASPYASPNYIVTVTGTNTASLTQKPSGSTALTVANNVYTITLYRGETLRLASTINYNYARWTTNTASSGVVSSTKTFDVPTTNAGTTTYYLYQGRYSSTYWMSKYATIQVVVKDITESLSFTLDKTSVRPGETITMTASYGGDMENIAYLWWTTYDWDGNGAWGCPFLVTTSPQATLTVPDNAPDGDYYFNVDVVAYDAIAGKTFPLSTYSSVPHLACPTHMPFTIYSSTLGELEIGCNSTIAILGSNVKLYGTHTRTTTDPCYYFWWSGTNNYTYPIAVTTEPEADIYLDPSVYNSSNTNFSCDAVYQSSIPSNITEPADLMEYYDNSTNYAAIEKVISNRVDINYLIPYPSGTSKVPDTIEGVNTSGAISLHLFDYWARNSSQYAPQTSASYSEGINSYYSSSNFAFFNSNGVPSGNNVGGRASNYKNAYRSGGIVTGIMENYLNANNNGVRLPVFNNGFTDGSGSVNNASTGYLFDYSQDYNYMTSYSANRLFQYDENTGHYYYRSGVNAAYYNDDTSDFTLYDNAVVVPYNGNESGINGGTEFARSGIPVAGNFFPFNDYIGDVQHVRSYSDAMGTVDNIDAYNATMSVNYWFGLSMETTFYISETVTAIDGTDLLFSFTGDDDVWIYIDDMLAVDLGGIHDAAQCEINFTTGQITVIQNVDNYYGYYQENYYSLYSVMQNAYNTLYNDVGANEFYMRTGYSTVATLMSAVFRPTGSNLVDGNGNTILSNGNPTALYSFQPNSAHRLNFYYMERGGNLSDLSLMFNISPVENGFVIEKQIDDFGDFYKDDMGFNFKLFYMYNRSLISGYGSGWTEETALTGGESMYSLYYVFNRTTGEMVGDIHDIDETGFISLEAGQYAVFPNLPPYWYCRVAEISCYYFDAPNELIPIEESEFNVGIIENGVPVAGTSTGYFPMTDAVSVKVINTIGKPCELTVTKLIDLEDLDTEFGNLIFFFTLEDAEGRVYTEVIEFTDDNYTVCPNDPTKIQITKTFTQLPHGEYTMSEMTVNRFRLAEKWGEGNSFVDDNAPGSVLHFSLTPDYENGDAFYYNDLFHSFYYSDAAFRDNEMTIVEP